MKIQLYSGNTHLGFELPDEVSFIRPEVIKPNIDKAAFIEKLVFQIDGFNIPTNKKPVSIAIVVADKTRLSELPVFMPWIEKALLESDLPNFDINFFIAYGSHPKQSESESLASYGDIYSRYQFTHHDARSGNFQDFGTTLRGTRILINERLFNNNDLVITFGAISHHYFAGFGGGRKLIFPGLASLSSIKHNHSLFLDFPNKSLRANCQSGVLDDNPLAEDLKEIYEKLPATIGIHTVLNQKGKVCEFKIGSNYDSFIEACRVYEANYRTNSGETYDMVLASTGGFPKDVNFIQSHKSIHSASRFVKDNGKLILMAECRDGIGNSRLLEIFNLKDWDKVFPADREKYENNTGTALAQLQKSARIQIQLITSMDEEVCKLLGVEKTDFQTVQTLIDNHNGSIGVIENASLIY